MSFPRYPKYKASGVEWLGEVPEHWGVTALKRGFGVTLGKMLQPESNGADDELRPYLRAANIQWGGVDTNDIKQMWLSPRDQAQLRLEGGDLLVSEGGDVGRSCLWADELDECYFQNSVNRVRAHEGNSNRYLCYWMSVIKDKGYIDVLCNKSTIAHFTAEKVAAVPVPFPPSAEQTRITDFLDQETGKIDELVAEQRRLLELLKEKRQAVISHAVTKGLNPKAPLKPSGIEWLGDVPAHWAVTRLAYAAEILAGFPFNASLFASEGIPVIRMSDFGDGVVVLDEAKRVAPEEAPAESRAQTGDILIGLSGSISNFALVGASDLPIAINQRIAIIRAFTGYHDWVRWFLQSAEYLNQLVAVLPETTIQNVSMGQIRQCRLPDPPPAERDAIIAHLDIETAKFDLLTAEAQRAIDLLQERRTALISAAVTGQIDVRPFDPKPQK